MSGAASPEENGDDSVSPSHFPPGLFSPLFGDDYDWALPAQQQQQQQQTVSSVGATILPASVPPPDQPPQTQPHQSSQQSLMTSQPGPMWESDSPTSHLYDPLSSSLSPLMTGFTSAVQVAPSPTTPFAALVSIFHGGGNHWIHDSVSLGPHNINLEIFLQLCNRGGGVNRSRHLRPRDAIVAQLNNPTTNITYTKLDGDHCDFQGIDWTKLGITRENARARRKCFYRNYVSIPYSDRWQPKPDEDMMHTNEAYFRFRRMRVKRNLLLPHFQLRNLLACNTRTRAYYADRRGLVQQYNPLTGISTPAMRFRAHSKVMISTLASGQGMLIAGGFNGEYCVANMDSEYVNERPFESVFTSTTPNGCYTSANPEVNNSGITNHAEVHSLRTASGPLATFASNDMGLRLLDLHTQTVLSTTVFDFAPNCTAISPDRRLRVVVGDHVNALIVAAEPERSLDDRRGHKAPEVLQELHGHRDYGFACAWAPDGYTLATGNQDCGIKIWDARKWCDTAGDSTPVITMRTQMATPRSLNFSPAGSGARLLIVGEEADHITAIDAQTFRKQQLLDVFGELAGVTLTDDGQDLLALCADPWRGGMVQFERRGMGGMDDTDADPAADYDGVRNPLARRRCSWRGKPSPFDWAPVGSSSGLGGSATAATAAALAAKSRRQQQLSAATTHLERVGDGESRVP